MYFLVSKNVDPAAIFVTGKPFARLDQGLQLDSSYTHIISYNNYNIIMAAASAKDKRRLLFHQIFLSEN